MNPPSAEELEAVARNVRANSSRLDDIADQLARLEQRWFWFAGAAFLGGLSGDMLRWVSGL